MNLKMTLAALLLAPLALTACKKNEAPEQTAAASDRGVLQVGCGRQAGVIVGVVRSDGMRDLRPGSGGSTI